MKYALEICNFFIKTLILVVLFSTAFWFFLPSFSGIENYFKSAIADRANQAMTYSFIQNPVALLIASDRDVERQRFSEAALKLELAIGLLEMHGATDISKQLYINRLLAVKKLTQEVERK